MRAGLVARHERVRQQPKGERSSEAQPRRNVQTIPGARSRGLYRTSRLRFDRRLLWRRRRP